MNSKGNNSKMPLKASRVLIAEEIDRLKRKICKKNDIIDKLCNEINIISLSSCNTYTGEDFIADIKKSIKQSNRR